MYQTYWLLFQQGMIEEANFELQEIAEEQKAAQVEVELDAEFLFNL